MELLDIEAPADQARGQAGVLPLAPDGDGQVLGRHLQQDAMIFFIQNDLARHGRLKCLDYHLFRVCEIVDDVDLLTVELAHDGLDTCTTGADASADRVHFRVGADHCDLGAVTRLAGERFDLHCAVSDFANLNFEQAANKLGAGAGEHELGAARGAFDCQQQATDAVAGLIFFAGNLFFNG